MTDERGHDGIGRAYIASRDKKKPVGYATRLLQASLLSVHMSA